jgi:chromate transport protein ChrA
MSNLRKASSKAKAIKAGKTLMLGSFLFAFVQIPAPFCAFIFFIGLVVYVIGQALPEADKKGQKKASIKS